MAEEVIQERSPEVQAEIAARIDSVKEFTDQELREMLTERKVEITEETSAGWMRKKLKYCFQQEVLSAHGLSETPKMAENHAKVDLEKTKKSAAKSANGDMVSASHRVGRKAMVKTGTFVLALGDKPNFGREGSAKHGILTGCAALARQFTYDEFKQITSAVLKWDEATTSFGANTRFPSLDAATNAWFSELKNKAKVIVNASDVAAVLTVAGGVQPTA